MEITITCEQYCRLTPIPASLDEADQRKYLRSLFIERKNNKAYIVGTNVKIAVVEYLGVNNGPDEFTALAIDTALITACEKEIEFNSQLTIIANPMLGFTNVKTTFGYIHPANLHVNLPDINNLCAWRDWLDYEMPKASHGVMFWDAENIAILARSSLSGCIRFPQFIDTRKPVLICDYETNNWIGVFMTKAQDGQEALPAIMPDWIDG